MALTEEQPAWVPKFTRKGFEKTKIPPDVYAMLLWDYERQKTSFKVNSDSFNGNNQIINNKKKAQSSIKTMNVMYIMDIRYFVFINVKGVFKYYVSMFSII